MALLSWLLLGVPLTFALGGLASLALSGRSRAANLAGPAFALLGCAVTAIVAVMGLSFGAPPRLELAWSVRGARFALESDALSGWFLAPVAMLGGLTAIYGRAYLSEHIGRKNLALSWAAFNLMLGGMATALLARDGVLFLIAWELMSLAAWVLVSFEDERDDVRAAGWVYLVATHAGTTALFVLFLLLRQQGGADFGAMAGSAPPASLLLLALFGFGAKAGIVPLHIWLPGAHAAAPSHVSALMSGVLVKMGIYGILRVVLELGAPPAWFGTTLIALGLLGALLGIALAIGQRDLKRVLAYSTIENMGIIVLGVGLGLWGWARGDATTAALGLGGALLHVWNHAAMKGLMFLSAGSVLHATGTRDLEALGGLMRRMPWTGTLFLLGAVAISGLPPLNGSVGEWLLYLGFFRGGSLNGGVGSAGLLSAVGLLSLVGALAAVCFARLIGVAMLGAPRAPAHAHEAPTSMLAPMAILAAVCVGLGVGGAGAMSAASGVIGQLVPGAPTPDLAPLSWMSLLLWALLLSGAIGLARALRKSPTSTSETWGCGYLAPTPRMQYTGRSFAELTETNLVPAALQPRTHHRELHGLFPHSERSATDYGDPTLRGIYQPLFRRWALRFTRMRRFQHGQTWLYVGYIGVAFVLALAWSAIRAGALP